LTVEEVLRDAFGGTSHHLGDLSISIVSNLPFGDDSPNAALPVNVIATFNKFPLKATHSSNEPWYSKDEKK